ncbi:TetR/AcrR family transcriptional regulator [Dietzia cinnamea]|uniref:TetR/AcrR family transcriptional regulator n=1 Tax=Dietzia cinnamea TaxID=321318 RepID=UPI0021A49AE8|nr:TetR family transcriptional regulator [Dietzia cinnamea]MCT2058407.1 TetR family transcriptional regulator [Dietzia cinnamea]
MATKPEILDAALDVLRSGVSLTLDAVAREAGLTKPGVVHHFATKEALSLAVLDHLLDRWEQELRARAGEDASAGDRLRAYAEHTLLGDMDAADLALLADPKLRDKLSARCSERMSEWFGDSRDPRLVAARLVADGAWIDRCLGLLDLDETERADTAALVASLIAEGDAS